MMVDVIVVDLVGVCYQSLLLKFILGIIGVNLELAGHLWGGALEVGRLAAVPTDYSVAGRVALLSCIFCCLILTGRISL